MSYWWSSPSSQSWRRCCCRHWKQAKEMAKRSNCRSNLHQLGLVLLMYGDENKDRLPVIRRLAFGRGMFATRVANILVGLPPTAPVARPSSCARKKIMYCPSYPEFNKNDHAWTSWQCHRYVLIGLRFSADGRSGVQFRQPIGGHVERASPSSGVCNRAGRGCDHLTRHRPTIATISA